MKALFHFRSMKLRLAFWLALMGGVSLLVLGAVWFQLYQAQYRVQEEGRLVDRHVRSLAALDRWTEDLTSTLSVLAETPLYGDPHRARAAEDLLSVMARTLPSVGHLFLVDAQSGRVWASSDPKRLGRDLSGDPCVARTLQSGTPVIAVVHGDRPGDALHVEACVSARSSEVGRPGAVLMATLSTRAFAWMKPHHVPEGQGATYLRMGDRFYRMEDGRWERPPVGLDESAVGGGARLKRLRDAAGRAFYGVASPVAGTDWSLWTLVDAAAIDGPVASLRARMVASTVLGALLLLGAGFVLARRIAHPLEAMARVSRRVQEGDLGARCEVNRPDELGVLALSYNHVLDSLGNRLERQRQVAALHETMVAAVDLDAFVHSVLGRLMEMTEAQAGACHVLDSRTERFEPQAWQGLDKERLASFDAASADGELGRAVATQSVVHVTDVSPDTRFIYKAVAGGVVPREWLSVPVSDNGRVRLVFSLIRLAPFRRESLELVEEVRHALDTACARVVAVQEIQDLTDLLSERNQELESQKEELQNQSEELAEQAEELRLQAEELREQNVELELQQRRLQEANRLKDEFLSNMSHELRTPLNSILALSRVLDNRLGADLSEEHRRFLHIIERNGRVLLGLINDILDLSKVESGNMDVFPEAVSVPALVETVVENIRPLADKKGLEVKVSLATELPTVETDAKRLYQILQNLVGNAVKFTESGHVEISARPDGDQVVLAVRDTGIGIAAEDLPHIFDKFRQADGTTSRRFEGTGLGLAIAKRLSELLGGDLGAESRPGQGSVFTLRLPVSWQGTGQVMAPASLQRVSEESGPEVVVVEDDEQVRGNLAGWLKEAGYSVRGFASAQEALEACRRKAPAAIVMDVILPGMDGYEALRRMRKQPELKDVAILIMSAARDGGTAKLLGADGFVGKPLKRERLLSCLRSVLQGRGKDFDPAAKRLLVVEDNETAVLHLCSILESAGYRPDVARTCAEALDYVDRVRPDGIILDLMMPDVSGLDLLERIRQRSDLQEVPVLVLTAKELTAQDWERLESNHIFQLIPKGDVDGTELLEKIRTMLSGPEKKVEGAAAQGAVNRQTARDRSSRPRILVVEDNPDNRVLFHAILDEHYEVRDAENGREGLRLIGQWRPDLVLLDMSLPEMSGYEVARRVKADPNVRTIPLIAVTAHAMPADRRKSREAGCDDHLSKPFQVEELLALVGRWLRSGARPEGETPDRNL
ncbi:GAF domain-containing protein [Desulfacinum hydrothermale DSM 13146]|uniref:histidine kinase n=1 Tax=Desulfacinum hydrothermale DSM 13146 TaxID=1121390 RepID=A0A1W1WY68_9BACT|nr:response regulator [Desulfacinum hydrothermale]SMC16679.1 GAF domain-containing protein [Desulfacinum hydrothermale DSM 13146]